MFSIYHHAYQINQESVQKSLFKALFIFMTFQTPSPSTHHNSRMRKNFVKKNASWLLPLDSPIALILHAPH